MKSIFGLSLFLFSLILLMEDVKSLVLTGLSIFFLLTEGTEFDFEKNKFRKLKSILGLRFGQWKALPNIDYISVFKTTENTVLRSRSAETNVSNEVIKLNLFYSNNQKIEAYITNDKEDAFKKAHIMAKKLNVDILDATERDTKWL